MIRKLFFLALAGLGLFSCKDDEEIGFDVPVEFRKELSFRPIPGGSVMNYYLPRNSDIFGVRVRYNDARGMEVVKEEAGKRTISMTLYNASPATLANFVRHVRFRSRGVL